MFRISSHQPNKQRYPANSPPPLETDSLRIEKTAFVRALKARGNRSMRSIIS